MAQKKPTKRGQRRRRERRVITHAVAHIKSTYNNTIVTLTDPQGKVLFWATGGTAGFKHTKKGTPFAAQIAAQSVGRKALDIGIKKLDILVKGPGPGKDTAVRALQGMGFEVTNVKEISTTPHNGCKLSRRRRV